MCLMYTAWTTRVVILVSNNVAPHIRIKKILNFQILAVYRKTSLILTVTTQYTNFYY